MRLTPFTFLGAFSAATLPLGNQRYLVFANTKSIADPIQHMSDIWKSNQEPLPQGKLSEIQIVRGGSIGSRALSFFSEERFSLFYVKALLQFSLTVLNVLCWALPFRNKRIFRSVQALGSANAFAGGVFLMLAFTHMIPHSLSVLSAAGIDSSIAFKFTVLGYMLVFTIEKILFDSHEILHQAVEVPEDDGTLSNDADSRRRKDPLQSGRRGAAPGEAKVSPLSAKAALVLLLAMAVHSLFETVALGMSSDRTSSVLMATSIALHQPAESIALLVALVKSSLSPSSIIKLLSAFSMVGPVGVMLGSIIQREASPMVEGALVAATAGTFLYVGATEIIAEEFENAKGADKMRKYFALLAGIVLIGAISEFGGDDHHHEHISEAVSSAIRNEL